MHPPDRAPPRVVFFDVMDTLVRDPFREVMPRALGMSFEHMMRAKHPSAWAEFELDAISESQFLERFLPGHDWDAAAFCAAVAASYEWLPGVPELLDALRARQPRIQLHTLSNYPCWYRWVEDCCALSARLHGRFVSYETGARKPDAEAYLRPCRSLGIEPAQALFVDDRAVNCAAAQALGMDAIVFSDAVQLCGELQARGLL